MSNKIVTIRTIIINALLLFCFIFIISCGQNVEDFDWNEEDYISFRFKLIDCGVPLPIYSYFDYLKYKKILRQEMSEKKQLVFGTYYISEIKIEEPRATIISNWLYIMPKNASYDYTGDNLSFLKKGDVLPYERRVIGGYTKYNSYKEYSRPIIYMAEYLYKFLTQDTIICGQPFLKFEKQPKNFYLYLQCRRREVYYYGEDYGLVFGKDFYPVIGAEYEPKQWLDSWLRGKLPEVKFSTNFWEDYLLDKDDRISTYEDIE